MKLFFLLIIPVLSIILISCGNSPEKVSPGATNTGVIASSYNRCFLHVSGNANQDTAYIHLRLQGPEVEGEFDNRPFEKDKRTGRLTGSISDSIITAQWIFMQEGVSDTLPLQFQLSNNQLLQKAFSYDTKTGREFIADTASFSIFYTEVACP